MFISFAILRTSNFFFVPIFPKIAIWFFPIVFRSAIFFTLKGVFPLIFPLTVLFFLYPMLTTAGFPLILFLILLCLPVGFLHFCFFFLENFEYLLQSLLKNVVIFLLRLYL